MLLKNLDIRQRAADNAVLLWQVAEKLGVADATFSRWLRRELPPEMKQTIYHIIDQLIQERKEEKPCS